MIVLDRELVFTARRLIDGANVHRLKEMIFAYEQAVELHNRQWPSHRTYQRECEDVLRAFVVKEGRRRLKIAV